MSGFAQHDWSLRTGSKYTVTGEVNVEAFDNWFKERVYCGKILVMGGNDLDNFLLLLQRMHQSDDLPGYDFLFTMPDYEREEWVEKACRKLARLHKDSPDAFPVDGIVASFDRLRAWRKAKSKASKSSAGGVSKMTLE